MSMREIPLLIIALIVSVLICGCASTPDTLPSVAPTDTPVSPATTLPQPTFMALTPQYTPLPAPAATITPRQNEIVGSWVLVIDPNPNQYTGSASFNPDGTGSISGGVLFPEETQSLTWNDTGIYNGLANFEAYTITVGDRSINAVIGPSGHLTSDLLPDGAYLARH